MATGSTSTGKRGTRLNFIGLKAGETAPPLAVIAVARDGKVIHSAAVGADGQFDLPEAALKSAHRILIGPADSDPSGPGRSAFAQYRPAQFAELVKGGVVNLARGQWELWRFFITCVTGSVRLCRRPPWWFADLAILSQTSAASRASMTRSLRRVPAAQSLGELVAWPFRCSSICNGRVEVYRRTCCCLPWVIEDPRLPDLIHELEEVVKFPPIPWPPDPGPGPDSYMPSAGPETGVLKGGTLDERTLYAARDLQALRTLPKAEVAAYVMARPYLRCIRHCGTTTMVGQGDINPDGRFNICWFDWPRPLMAFCHDEYAYKVKQRFGPFWLTVYDGVAANVWFSVDQDATLVSSSPWAYSCRPPGEPGTGAFVYLDVIGDTGSYELETPNATEWDRVAAPGATSGLVFPSAASPLDRHRNWGGTLKLNYMFSEDLRLIGAKYYRVSITDADALGAPTGARHNWDQGLSWRKTVVSGFDVNIVAVNLGPTTVGSQTELYEIPYDVGMPPGENWEADQYHVYLDTLDTRWSDPTVRHLVTVEIFDAAGNRLRPNGTPATGQPGPENAAAFTYRRKTAEIGPTLEVPFGALTHLFWWDNRLVQSIINQLMLSGAAFNGQCQFLEGTTASTFGIMYQAFHPEPLFHRDHSIWWKRGLAGDSGNIPVGPTGNVPVSSPSGTETFGTMLHNSMPPPNDFKKCAFTVFLHVNGKTTDGDDLDYPWDEDSAAFALEVP